ncbi:angiotensin-converting enzyme-like [Uloborus diversus]|uniref:angiotensin-converting enzyme-like n=1 Tax=Uloborus diversus TaxID=327109 RepID=UPI00240974A0|nr:angiotensin-converting enzyme-like [Uloborus diversus]
MDQCVNIGKPQVMKNIPSNIVIAAWLVVLGLSFCSANGEREDMKTIIERKCPEKNPNYDPNSLSDAKRYLRLHNCRYRRWLHYAQSQDFKYQTDLTEENRQALLKMKKEFSEFMKETTKKANEFNWKEFEDKNDFIFAWFRTLSKSGSSAFPSEKLEELMCEIPDLAKVLYTSRNYDELKYIWREWRNATNRKLKKMYLQYMKLSNEMARSDGFEDYGDMLQTQEGVKNMEDDFERLWEQVKPLFKQIHAFTRRRLIQQYGSKYIRPDGPIPAHILGHMFSQSWTQIFDILNPFPETPSPDVTAELQRRKMKPIEMFKIAEEFFISLGMHPMTKLFWQNSVIEKPKNKEMVCHASAWNFYDGKDFRIKMCTQVNMREFVTVHHEMGHIQYYLQYSHLPAVFQQGANPGFHEAVGDAMALSVSTPTHLEKLKLLKNFPNDSNSDVIFLLKMALDKVVFVPSSYIYDLWRWKIFSGEIPQKEMNTHWWKMRSEYEGLCPPVRRTDDDLDPLAKYHVPTDAAYVSKMLSLGSSVPWTEALAIVTKGETDELSAGPLLEYFEPLYKWLKEQNRN